MKILNTWRSKPEKLEYYEVGQERYRNGDYAAYPHYTGFLYTFKDIAINNLVGFNKELVDQLASGKRPEGKYSPSHFLFDQAMESKQRGLLLSNHTNHKQ